MPTITGAAGMPVWRFLCIDIVAALGWAPCYILPGLLFGASLDLAAQVAGRLALLLLLVLTAVWLLVWALRWLLAGGAAWGRGHAERLLAWSRRHRRLGLLGPALALLALLLLALTLVLYGLVWDWGTSPYPLATDALVHYLGQNLKTPWSDFMARALAHLSAPDLYLPLAGAVGLTLYFFSGRRAALHWLAAIAFVGVLVLGLHWFMRIPTPADYYLGNTRLSGFAGGHILISAVVYGFLAVILATPHRPAIRQIYYSAFTALIVLIALARLYLGLDWLSDILIGMGIAGLWVWLLTLGYRRHRPRSVRPRILLACVFAAVTAALIWPLSKSSDAEILTADSAVQATTAITDWYQQGYALPPAHINDTAGRKLEPLNVQISGNLDTIIRQLNQAGWQAPINASMARSLLWLAPRTPISGLPVLPRIHDGRGPAITLTLAVDADMQWVIRLWQSRFVDADNQRPVWLGQVAQQVVQRRLSLLRMPADNRNYYAGLSALRASLDATKNKLVRLPDKAGGTNWLGEILLWKAANTERDGRMSDPMPTPATRATDEPRE